MNSYKDLFVWQKSTQLVFIVYKITAQFPENEKFGLTSQMRRAAISIPSNLAEGYGRSGLKENKQFVNIAYGSALELETQVLIAKELKYGNGWEEIDVLLGEVQKMLYKYRSYLESRL